MRRALLVVACACACACGGKSDPPKEERAEIPCADVARHAAKLLDGDATWFAQLCEDGWSRKLRACVRAAATKRELDDCGLEVPPRVVRVDKARTATDDTPHPIRVTLTASGEVYVNGDRVLDAELDRRLASLPKGSRVLIAADKNAVYANVVKLMDRIQGAGLTDMSLEGAPP